MFFTFCILIPFIPCPSHLSSVLAPSRENKGSKLNENIFRRKELKIGSWKLRYDPTSHSIYTPSLLAVFIAKAIDLV